MSELKIKKGNEYISSTLGIPKLNAFASSEEIRERHFYKYQSGMRFIIRAYVEDSRREFGAFLSVFTVKLRCYDDAPKKMWPLTHSKTNHDLHALAVTLTGLDNPGMPFWEKNVFRERKCEYNDSDYSFNRQIFEETVETRAGFFQFHYEKYCQGVYSIDEAALKIFNSCMRQNFLDRNMANKKLDEIRQKAWDKLDVDGNRKIMFEALNMLKKSDESFGKMMDNIKIPAELRDSWVLMRSEWERTRQVYKMSEFFDGPKTETKRYKWDQEHDK